MARGETDMSEPSPDLICVLAGHGIPPADFPRAEMAEFMKLHARHEIGPESLAGPDGDRYAALHDCMRHWPRTPENDPYAMGLNRLAAAIEREIGAPVRVGYNEFCAPAVAEAISAAATEGYRRIVVVPSMLTSGGSHSERDIREIVQAVQDRHPHVQIVYAWPFDEALAAQVFAAQVKRATGWWET